jgi:hypothetical protein
LCRVEQQDARYDRLAWEMPGEYGMVRGEVKGLSVLGVFSGHVSFWL